LCIIAGLVYNGQSFEVVIDMKEDEITLSHKGKMETHTHLCNSITGGQLQESIGAESRIKLAHKDSQGKDKEKNLDAMLRKYDDEFEFPERINVH
jgi:hypothetical protein